MRWLLSTLVELVGVGLTAFGLWMLAPWVGVTVGGVLLVGVGFALGNAGR